MTDTRPQRSSFLSRLKRSTSGNTLALGAAAIIPLVGMIGGGLDMSRAYLVKSRVQQACDAAALAARKKLSGSTIQNGAIPADIRQQADNFFEANFEDGSYGSRNTKFTLTAGNDTRMDGAASVDLPMSMMKIFGFDKKEIAVTCSAELNLPNVDVLLVLDQSGSMKSGSRMQDLREAVFAFYDQIEAAKPPGARIRIGVVPYSGAVNVGRILVDEDPDWIADNWSYQTRQAEFDEVVTPGRKADPVRQIKEGTVESQDIKEIEPEQRYLVPYKLIDWRIQKVLVENTVTKVDGDSPLRWPTDNNAARDKCNAATNDDGGQYIAGDELWVISSDNYKEYHFTNGNPDWRGACDLKIHRFKIKDPEKYRNAGLGDTGGSDPTTSYVFSHYRHYQQDNLDTSQFKLFENVKTPTGKEGAWVTSRWNGCIEERKTVAATSFSPIPAGALDLDINLVPDRANPDTQWKAQWPQITFARRSRDNQGPDDWTTTSDRGTHSFNCPSPARRLQEYPSAGGGRNADFEDYINSLSPTGGTMHDIGMIWAGRFVTANGLFAADNASAPNGDPISRHIIFMTDGEMGADPRNYTAYGNPSMDGRFMGFKGGGMWKEPDVIPVNNARLAAVCERIKSENITVWSITFELDQNNFTENCATGKSRAFEADGGDELADAFRKIASSIAELRLVN